MGPPGDRLTEPRSTGGRGVRGRDPGGTGAVARYASLVRLPHTLFALPLAGLGVVLAAYGHPVGPGKVVLVVVAFSAARFAAMAFNRLVDREHDALNPRTRDREIPAGRISPRAAAVSVAVAGSVFVGSAFLLNPLAGRLSLPALAAVLLYSYAKRVTALSHHILGLCLGIAPAGGYVAVAGVWPRPWYGLVVLALAVAFWVAGFDVIYAIQDEEFDRRVGLHSIPARWGRARSLLLARLFHLTAWAGFLLFPAVSPAPLGAWYLAGVGAAGLLLAYEHRVVRGAARGRLSPARVDRAFFHVNVLVSGALFLFTLLDRVTGG